MNHRPSFNEKPTDKGVVEDIEQQEVNADFFEKNNEIEKARLWLEGLEKKKAFLEEWIAEETTEHPDANDGWVSKLQADLAILMEAIQNTKTRLRLLEESKKGLLDLKLRMRKFDEAAETQQGEIERILRLERKLD